MQKKRSHVELTLEKRIMVQIHLREREREREWYKYDIGSTDSVLSTYVVSGAASCSTEHAWGEGESQSPQHAQAQPTD